MTDLEAIKQYPEMMTFWEMLFFMKEPRIFWDSPEIMAQREERRQRRMQKVEKALQQAESALNSLPRREWKTVLIYRYILRKDLLQTADAVFYSESTVQRFESRAVKFLEANEAQKRP